MKSVKEQIASARVLHDQYGEDNWWYDCDEVIEQALDTMQLLLDENEKLKKSIHRMGQREIELCDRIELFEDVVDAVTGGIPSQITAAIANLKDPREQ